MALNHASEEFKPEKPVNEQSDRKMVIHMNIAAHQCLSRLLRPNSPGHDWKSLAGLMGFSVEEVLKLEYDVDPVESVIRQWERECDATIDKLLSFLHEIERFDTIEDLKPFIYETPTPSEYEERKKQVFEDHQQSPAVGRLPIELERLTVSDEIFDGFICYAKEDRSFAHEILTTLEAAPYYRKICIDYRDYVPGNCRLDQAAKIIENRCKRLVAVMSPNFTNSSNAGFQVRIALNLSPDYNERRVIPVLYKNCEIPKILEPIYYLNYEDPIEQGIFWKRLASSLGYIEPSKPRGSPRVHKKTEESATLQKKTKESPLLEKKGSPSAGKKMNFFNIIKSKK